MRLYSVTTLADLSTLPGKAPCMLGELALRTHLLPVLAGRLHGGLAAELLELVVGHDLRTDEAPLKVRVDRARCLRSSGCTMSPTGSTLQSSQHDCMHMVSPRYRFALLRGCTVPPGPRLAGLAV